MDMDEEQDEKKDVYVWEKEYEIEDLEILAESEESFRSLISESKKRKRKRQSESRNIRRGMTRHLFLILDTSKAMNENDLKPSRIAVAENLVESFIRDFFDQNPLSQFGLIITKNSIAEKLTDLSGNPSKHIMALRKPRIAEGEVSLQNALNVARSSLAYTPKYANKEVVIIFGSLTSCDPGDIFQTIDQLKRENVKVSIISLAAEVHVCKAIATATSGNFGVCLNEDHFQELLFMHSPPPPSNSKIETSLIRMGFPQIRTDDFPSLCVCHRAPKYMGYFCPQCHGKYCELPTDCQLCGLTLISSPHLARSYHHLFPIPAFIERPCKGNDSLICYSCRLTNLSTVFYCSKCRAVYCSECDDYIHESLHNCPGCEMKSVSEPFPQENGGIVA